MTRAEEQALKAYPRTDDVWDECNVYKRIGYRQGYEQAIKDVQELFNKMQASADSAIDAVKVLGSLLDNPNIRKKLGKSKPIPKKPIKTNPFLGGEKK